VEHVKPLGKKVAWRLATLLGVDLGHQSWKYFREHFLPLEKLLGSETFPSADAFYVMVGEPSSQRSIDTFTWFT
jgi:hypothetical protein